MRSKRFKTLRFFAPLLDLPKLLCLDMCRNLVTIGDENYLIFGIYALAASSPLRAFPCSLYPVGKLSFNDPVFSEGARFLRGERFLLSVCLLIRTIGFSPKNAI
jgi:hypothetical protein